MNADKCFKTGLWGSIIAAICCFTPLLVLGLGVIGVALCPASVALSFSSSDNLWVDDDEKGNQGVNHTS